MNSSTPAMPINDRNFPNDQELLADYLAGKEEAATQLYTRYAEQLRKLATRQSSARLSSRVDPEDIVQSVFRTFFRRLSSDQYSVPDGDDLWRLFLVISLNKIRNLAAHHNAAKRDIRRTAALGNVELHQLASSPNGDQELTLLHLSIEELLLSLPESSQEIVRLRLQEHNVNEIAALTGRAKRSVERILQQFRDQLKAQVDEEI